MIRGSGLKAEEVESPALVFSVDAVAEGYVEPVLEGVLGFSSVALLTLMVDREDGGGSSKRLMYKW